MAYANHNSTAQGGLESPFNVNGHDDTFDANPYDYSPYQPYQNMSNQPDERPAPPSGPPPLYYRILTRTYRGSLRPALLCTCGVALLYLILLGAQNFRLAGESGLSTKYRLLTIVQGILFMAAAGIEAFGFLATWTSRLVLARLYSMLSLVGFGAILASQVLGIIIDFTMKTDVIAVCLANYPTTQNTQAGGTYWNGTSEVPTIGTTDQTAMQYCNGSWSRSRTWDIVWLVVSASVGTFFVMLSFAYARQLSDPSSVRTKVQQAPAAPAYGMGGAYDPDGQVHSYPPRPYGAYAPPAMPPPQYERRPSLDDIDFDAKSIRDYGQPYPYEQEPTSGLNRAGSSRSAARPTQVEDEDADASKPRDSGETLRGEPALKGSTKAQLSGVHQEDDDHDTPRI